MMKKVDVFEGDSLNRQCPPDNENNVRCRFFGTGAGGTKLTVPFTDDILGRHLLFLGGIGKVKRTLCFK